MAFLERKWSEKDTRYFKGSKDLIESITGMFGKGRFSIIFVLYKKDKNGEKIKQQDYLEVFVEDYYLVLKATIELYGELKEFINCIENKRLFKFIRMVS